MKTNTLVAALITSLSATASAAAQPATAARGSEGSGLPAAVVPAPLREVGFDQHLEREIPPDLAFVDERGERVTIGQYFGERPVVLSFVYFSCPMLCPQSISSLARTLKVLDLGLGDDFELVTVSIDPRETSDTAAKAKALYVEQADRADAAEGWHFLTGEPRAIEPLTRAAGFRYVWDDTLQQFAHPTGVVVVTPQGRIARYLFGIDYGARDLRLAILEASANRIGSVIDAVLLYCYHYDPAAGRYGLAVRRLVQVAGAVTVLGIAGLIAFLVRLERRDRS